MSKSLALFILLTSLVHANKSNKVEVFATSMDSKDNIVNATGDVIVVYKEYHLSAKRAIYNRNTGDLELFDNIRATEKNQYQLLGNYAKLNIASKEKSFKPFFMLEKQSQVWLSADDGKMKDKELDIASGSMSGCNPNDPLWTMEFSSSDYNSETKWLNLYNTVVYIYDIPVIYSPYVGFSLDTKRRSGILLPALGTSSTEGFYYEQPIYIAEQNWWDLELRPQVRSSRGYGGYSEFRFKDSPSSGGALRGGYFKEYKSYYKENDLANDTHYGFNFKYDNNDFINQWFSAKPQGQSGLYVDINSMNDVDYINLSSSDTINNATASQVLSRINMFYNTDEHYFGSYFKYYQDLTKQSNEKNIQVLPTLHYHNYLHTLLDKHLFYNVDIQSNNIYRHVDKKVVQTDINIPLTLQTSVFDEYLNLSYKTSLHAQHSSFSGEEKLPTDNEYKDGYMARNYNTVAASTELTKAYDDFTHVVSFGTNYSFAGGQKEDGFYEYNKDFCSDIINKNDARCEFYRISEMQDVLKFDFSQYIYDALGNQIIYHRLSQAIYYNEFETKTGELENELSYQITDNIHYYNNTFYNYDETSFSRLTNQITYSTKDLAFSIGHLYGDTFEPATEKYSPYSSYLTSSLSYAYNSHYSYHADYAYDLERSVKKKSEIGFMYRQRCWDFGIRFVENTRPILLKKGDSYIDDRYIFFTIALTPLMSSGSGSSEFAMRLPENSRRD